MIATMEVYYISMCVELFLYGKISVQWALTCTLAKEIQLFPGLGIYSGIFVIYLRFAFKESRTTTIVFYSLCLLYVLSTATIAGELLSLMIGVSNNSICKNIIF